MFMMYIELLTCLCLVLLKSVECEEFCKIVADNEVRDGVYSQNIVKRSSGPQHLKIILLYKITYSNPKYYSKIKKAMEKAAWYWEKALFVKVKKSDPLLAKRPFIGEVNFCSDEKNTLQSTDQSLANLGKHEIGHILGFNQRTYNNLPDLDYSFRLDKSHPRPVQNITLSWWTTRGIFNIQKTIIRLPNMLKEAKRHFGCKKLQGIELVKSHFSHRIMGDELMTPSMSMTSYVSTIGLAYLEDTGIYDVNYSMANRFTYGKGLGCDFVMKSCYEYIRNRQSRGQDIRPFCNKPYENKCLNSERAFGYCQLFRHNTELPRENQYMDSSFEVPSYERHYYGGQANYDYCPVLQKYRIDENRTSSCTSNISLKPDLTTNLFLQDLGFLWIIIKEERYKCPIEGGVVEISTKLENFNVSMHTTCPKCQEICGNKSNHQDSRFMLLQCDVGMKLWFSACFIKIQRLCSGKVFKIEVNLCRTWIQCQRYVLMLLTNNFHLFFFPIYQRFLFRILS
ncbi:Leishmanolysin-like peptidase [Schistosoma japonicum]|nr:Leishmanolysin-like peptidase [Schistosoma japonicum]